MSNSSTRNLAARRNFLKQSLQTIAAAPILNTLAIAEPLQKTAKAQSASSPNKPTLTLNIRDYGATGDGSTKDTAAIQQTIDRCAVLGGGEVLIPAGNFLTGAIQLRSHTLLRLAPDATLTGKGLNGASPIDPPKLPDPVPSPAAPYKLH